MKTKPYSGALIWTNIPIEYQRAPAATLLTSMPVFSDKTFLNFDPWANNFHISKKD